jgi:hypothetical protein
MLLLSVSSLVYLSCDIDNFNHSPSPAFSGIDWAVCVVDKLQDKAQRNNNQKSRTLCIKFEEKHTSPYSTVKEKFIALPPWADYVPRFLVDTGGLETPEGPRGSLSK